MNHVMIIRDAPTLFHEQDEKFPETELKKQNKPEHFENLSVLVYISDCHEIFL